MRLAGVGRAVRARPTSRFPASWTLPALPGGYRALLALTVLALVLRLWALGQVPPGVDADEAALGYNAYSLLETGRDEYGVPHPLVFESFGDYKRPVYFYLAVPSVAIFGLTPFAVRLPSALAGTLAVPVLYAVARQLALGRRAALGAAALLTVSPWHLQISRAAREVNLLLLALLVLAAALLAAVRSRRGGRAGTWYLCAAAAALCALYAYHSGPIIVPLLCLVLARAFWPRLRQAPRCWLVAAGALFALGSLPLLFSFAGGRAGTRLAQASLLNDETVLATSSARIARDRREGMPWVLQEPLFVAARASIDAYLSHFDPTFLFTRGDAEWRHHASDTGQLYLWDLPLIAAGLARVVRRWRYPAFQSIGGWLLVGPVPAMFAASAPHALRAVAMLPAWYLVAAAGLSPLSRRLRRRRWRRDWLLLLAASVLYYLFAYYHYYPVERGQPWSSGVVEGYRAAQAELDAGHFQRAVIVEQSGLSLIHALFAVRYDPRRYQEQGGSRRTPPSPAHPAQGPVRFVPYEFRAVDWPTEPHAAGVLYVAGGGTSLPPGARTVKEIPDLAGRTSVVLFAFDAPRS